MMSALLSFAQSGGLYGALLTSKQFYQTDYTKPLLFMADGGLLAGRATTQGLTGTQWGMMNETGSYPGQVWLWLYTFWYQIKLELDQCGPPGAPGDGRPQRGLHPDPADSRNPGHPAADPGLQADLARSLPEPGAEPVMVMGGLAVAGCRR